VTAVLDSEGNPALQVLALTEPPQTSSVCGVGRYRRLLEPNPTRRVHLGATLDQEM